MAFGGRACRHELIVGSWYDAANPSRHLSINAGSTDVEEPESDNLKKAAVWIGGLPGARLLPQQLGAQVRISPGWRRRGGQAAGG